MKRSNILFLVLFFPLFGLAQKDVISSKFSEYSNTIIQEKLLITTDRPGYVEEELIWFKIYVVDASSNKALDISRVAYVDLLDENNIPVLSAKIALQKGIGSGSFKLPKELSSGKYHLLGYTNWMKNFDQSFFARKSLTILGTAEQESAANLPKYDIQLFPEGGNLVNGLKSKIAFKVLGPNHIGQNLKGAVVNSNGDTLVRFSARKYGMGTFQLTPSSDAKLTAVFKLPNGEVLKKDLPRSYDSGVVMELARQADGMIVVNASVKNYPSGVLSLVAQTSNQIGFSETKSVSNGSVSFRFPEKDLKEGVSQITVFDASNKAICERLYFKKPSQVFAINAAFDQANYTNRKAVSLVLSAKEHANVSVSVYRTDDLNTTERASLVSDLWLGSEVKGNIEDAGFYVDPATDSSVEADNLMLTQGWRRFKWDDILSTEGFNVKYPPEYRGFLINTQLSSAKSVNTFATILEQSPKTLFAHSDSEGKATFLGTFTGKKTLIFQTDPNQDSVGRFSILNMPVASQSAAENLAAKSTLLTAFSSRYLDAQVQSRFEKPIFKTVKEDDWNIYALPTMVYNIDDYTKFPTIGETIREYIKGVSFRKQGDHQKIRISYKNALNSLDYMTDNSLVLFDGIPAFNIDDILDYKTLNIDQISVVQEKYHDNGVNMGGVFSIKSKDKNLSQFKSPNALVIDYEGFQQERIFYSPKYLTAETRDSKLPDFRQLLFWNPVIQMVPNQQQEINFYTSDRKGQYIGVIEGLTANGNASYRVVSFNIQ